MNLDEGWRRPTRFAAWGAILGAPLAWLVARQLGSDEPTVPALGCWLGALLGAALSRPESVWLCVVTGTAMALVYVVGGLVLTIALTWPVLLPPEWMPAAWWVGANVATLAVVGTLHRGVNWRDQWRE